jgi:hypothetical protein
MVWMYMMRIEPMYIHVRKARLFSSFSESLGSHIRKLVFKFSALFKTAPEVL